MSFYLCIGRWAGLGIEINYITGIRLIMGFVVIGIVSYHTENMMTSSIMSLSQLIQEVSVLAALVKQKLPEDYEKIYPPVQALTK